MKLGTIVSDLARAGNKVKLFLEKIGGEAPAEVVKITKDAEEIVPVIEKFVPGSTKAIALMEKLLDAAAQVVEDAGQAAGANALNVTLDTQTVTDLKAVIADAKLAAAPTPATA
jgi:hypothetical protein